MSVLLRKNLYKVPIYGEDGNIHYLIGYTGKVRDLEVVFALNIDSENDVEILYLFEIKSGELFARFDPKEFGLNMKDLLEDRDLFAYFCKAILMSVNDSLNEEEFEVIYKDIRIAIEKNKEEYGPLPEIERIKT